ncbi:S-adenosyl-L-methionine-dependent methyltransferase [Xylaria sp. CBS 124048]|nr:S-adenosyl-L-methionine-dependent methyltransferase [Xylaria sp. CBS 124048]
MESILQQLVYSLKSTSQRLSGDLNQSLNAALHDDSKLPDRKASLLAAEALDLLSEIRLLLEPGHLVLADHFLGYMSTKALCAAVELDIPDILQPGPLTLPELASRCGARRDRLNQVMRTLRNNGIFAYDASADSYRNNATSTLLRRDHWTQWRNWVGLYGNEFYDMARGIPQSLKKDAVRCPAQIEFNTDASMFAYFTSQGWIPKFHQTLSGGAIAQAPGIIEDYPWDEVADCKVIDIGGGGGGLIALLLRRYKTMRGAIFEAPRVIEQCKLNFHSQDGEYADVKDRMPEENLIVGDFFKEVTPSHVYTMKWCLHDWDDEKACAILKNIRKAILKSPQSRLVILESVLRDGHMGRMSRYGDMNMMVAVSGRERDERDWRRLAAATGWKVRNIYPLRKAWPSAIEFVPVWGLDGAADAPEQLVAEMRFLEPWNADRGNPFVRMSPAPGFDRTNFEWRSYPVTFTDARPVKKSFQLDKNGFAYFDDEISQDLIAGIRSESATPAKETYCRHVEQFVKKMTGAPRVIVFDHTLRKRRTNLEKTSNDDGKEQPATMVHCDQSEKGAIRRLKMNIGEDESVEELLKGRVQMMNVWRPLNGPVRDWPLATMDYQTIKASDMYPCDLLRNEYEERGQTATFVYRDEHEWYYLDEQQNNEVTVIKIWDSDAGNASKFCAHAAFNHPNVPPGTEPRESIEVRCLVIY